MENKYYTPTIEEFHVGFEFEINSASEENIWLPCMLYTLTDSLFNIVYEPDGVIKTVTIPDCIRVKYLDKEDIESLGFTHLPKKSLKGLTERFIIEGLHRRLNEEYDDTMWWNVYLEYAPDIKRVIIKGDISSGEYNEKFFEGVIKNKSELKVLLKQLGIIES